jgi:Ferritin-like domain
LPRQFTRSAFVATAFAAAAAAAPSALGAGPADLDLANARLLVTIELLLGDFYDRLLETELFATRVRGTLQRARFNETEHLAAVSRILTDAGQTAETAGDVDFSYPARVFSSRGGAAKHGAALERLALGAYLGAVDSTASPTYRLVHARIAASEACHLSVFELEATGHPIGNSFPDTLTIEQASDALGEYTS